MAQHSAEPGEPGYGPSLPELLGPRLRALGGWQRVGLVLLVAALAALAAALVVRHEASIKSFKQTEADARRRGLAPIPFHFDHSRKLRLSRRAGTYASLERRQGGTLVGRFTVSELEIGRQEGQVSGFMPIVATRYERDAARRYKAFRLQFEGRARVNDVEGYQFAFTARLERPGGAARQLLGRVVMLPEPYDHQDPKVAYPAGQVPAQGLLITMLATSLDNVPSATRVGDEGLLQRPYRSFRFGI
jgi:hypothetical protein